MQLDDRLANIKIDDIVQLNDLTMSTVRKCVEAICPKLDLIKTKELWEDPTLKQKLKALKKCYITKKFMNCKKKDTKKGTDLKSEYHNQTANAINAAAEARGVN